MQNETGILHKIDFLMDFWLSVLQRISRQQIITLLTHCHTFWVPREKLRQSERVHNSLTTSMQNKTRLGLRIEFLYGRSQIAYPWFNSNLNLQVVRVLWIDWIVLYLSFISGRRMAFGAPCCERKLGNRLEDYSKSISQHKLAFRYVVIVN